MDRDKNKKDIETYAYEQNLMLFERKILRNIFEAVKVVHIWRRRTNQDLKDKKKRNQA